MIIFNANQKTFKNPPGAVSVNTENHFKIFLNKDLHCTAVRLKIINEENVEVDLLNLFWCGNKEDENLECWECHFIPVHIGLYWYKFEIDTKDGTKNIIRSLYGNGKIDYLNSANTKEGSWQLTVYAEGFKTPDWLVGGVMYQIFPDRFFFSGKTKKNIPPDRIIRESWGEQPYWAPNKEGKVTNSDYFGGDLEGIKDKLPYLKSLGVSCLYLNPIFEAHSNHRYNTADYSKIDPLLGDEDSLKTLCQEANKLGIKIILDGVFSHTGDDSIYFNSQHRYEKNGAYNSTNSPYYKWYNFQSWPDHYKGWWGFDTLPEVDELESSYNKYINGEEGIVRKWLKAGAYGWRLDVADELPDEFLENLRASAKKENPDAIVLGEVWEDASNKVSYGHRRHYLLGSQLDSVMNYPFREAIIGFFTGLDGKLVMDKILSVVENYPKQVLNILMNSLGTHDTERTITLLAGEPTDSHDKKWQSEQKLSSVQRERGVRLMKAASAMQYTLPGVPCIYYGDEAGLEGYKDPFCRACYPWEREDEELIEWHRELSEIRKNYNVLKDGDFTPLIAEEKLIAYARVNEESELVAIFNSSDQHREIYTNLNLSEYKLILGGRVDNNILLVDSESCCFLIRNY